MLRIQRSALPLVALLAALTLVAGACGDSKDSASKKTTTTTAAKKSTTTGDGPTTTVSAKDYAAALDGAQQQLDAAKGDPCAIVAVFDSLNGLPDPTDEAEGKQAVTFLANLLTTVADTAPAGSEAQAAAIRTAATGLQSEAEAAGYSQEFLAGTDTPKALDTPEFKSAMTDFQTKTTAQCGAATSTTTAG